MSYEPDFKPSDVQLWAPVPLTACFGKFELELAAFILVRASQREGDVWGELDTVAIGAAIRDDIEEGVEPMFTLTKAPVFRPDMPGLVEKGFAAFVGEPRRAAVFTEQGFERLRRYVQRPTPAGGGAS